MADIEAVRLRRFPQQVSQLAKDLIMQMLTPSPEARPSATVLLSHEWVLRYVGPVIKRIQRSQQHVLHDITMMLGDASIAKSLQQSVSSIIDFSVRAPFGFQRCCVFFLQQQQNVRCALDGAPELSVWWRTGDRGRRHRRRGGRAPRHRDGPAPSRDTAARRHAHPPPGARPQHAAAGHERRRRLRLRRRAPPPADVPPAARRRAHEQHHRLRQHRAQPGAPAPRDAGLLVTPPVRCPRLVRRALRHLDI